MPVDEQRVGDVLGDHTSLVHIHVVNVVHDVDAATLTRIGWLHDPDVLFALMLLQLLIVVVKVAEFVRQDISVRAEIESTLAEALLQTHDVEAEAILTRNFVALREVVNLLVLVQTLVLVGLAGA